MSLNLQKPLPPNLISYPIRSAAPSPSLPNLASSRSVRPPLPPPPPPPSRHQSPPRPVPAPTSSAPAPLPRVDPAPSLSHSRRSSDQRVAGDPLPSRNVSKEESIWRYDRDLVASVFTRIRDADEAKYYEILDDLVSPSDRITMNRFVALLVEFGRHDRKSTAFDVGRIMISLLSDATEARLFILRLFRENIMGMARLNIIVRFRFYCFDPIIILDGIFNFYQEEWLEKAVIKFPDDKIMELMKFVATNSQSLPAILEKMRKFDCFKENYIPMPVAKIRDCHVLEFIEKVCKALRVDTPSETHLLEIRVSLEKYVVCYLKGETEIEDFYHLCAKMAIDDDDFRHCVQYLAQVSDPLAKFIAEVKNIPYETVATANPFKPGCKSPVDAELHRFGGGKMTILDDDAAVEEFGKYIADAAHFVAYYHRGS